ncbi:uncharacterized protein [Chaetodon trifascialis]|uniref:uncharacterized protein n=1 Tax=Chaetodon trifascialis TaxID=109706 RepID=UPI003992261B
MSSHMPSTYRDMFAVRAIALLCLVSVSHSAPLACEDLLKPLDQLDPVNLEGRWAMVAESLKIIESEEPFAPSDSISIDFHNSTFIKVNRYNERCHYFSEDISLVGPHYYFQVGQMYNFSGTFFYTSCADCVVLSFKVEMPKEKTEELCLFSKRREVDEKELREFIAQVECLKMPEHIVMDPTKELCPAHPHHHHHHHHHRSD